MTILILFLFIAGILFIGVKREVKLKEDLGEEYEDYIKFRTFVRKLNRFQ